MADVTLTRDLESFARGCVASGRHADLDEVVGAARRLLRAREARRGEAPLAGQGAAVHRSCACCARARRGRLAGFC